MMMMMMMNSYLKNFENKINVSGNRNVGVVVLVTVTHIKSPS